MSDYVGMPNKFTREWPSPSRNGVPRWDADHSHLQQSYAEAKTCFSWQVLMSVFVVIRCSVLWLVHAHAPCLCAVCFAVCDVSEPSPE